ncbi:uncharacterized protein LOC120547041 isoform X3 [Perca fluviatilis]|uniref:uncharacterized protein LOC120547041 isoform X3 n=1 Tax=Perca fluviatilis TaxID=8168 RepID=UPI0019630C93|nr:uncharacterized protein LOC120547041 isoform X3 [Perca fluviatilis]
MDANKVWQWRIMHVKKFSRHPEPFYHSNRIGLNFNVASKTQKKKELQLLTNGVMLEICDFAKTMNKNKMHFITNILENNFDLGLENEQQRVYFTNQIKIKVKDRKRLSLQDKNEVFTLFDISSKPECNSNMASTERKTESFLVEIDDTDDSDYEDTFKCSQATSKEYMKTEILSEEINGAHGDDSEHEDELKYSGAPSAEELKEDVLPSLFPSCEEIGLNLDIGSKQSLDLGLLTNGVMLELLQVTKILAASFSRIVLDVLGHNFKLDLESPQEKTRVLSKILYILNRRKQLMIFGKVSPEFENKPFSLQKTPFKRNRGSALSNMEALPYQFKEVTKRRQSDLKSKQEKRALLTSERANKRSRRWQSKDTKTNIPYRPADLCTGHTAKGDHCYSHPLTETDLDYYTGNERDMEQEEMETENNYTCPLGESDLDSDEVPDSGNTGNQIDLQSTKSCSLSSDISRESNSNCSGICAPTLTTIDISSTLSTVNSNVNPPFVSPPDERVLCGDEEQTQNPRKSPNECDMEQEKRGTENNYTCPLGEFDLDSDTGNEFDMEQKKMETEKNMWKLRANRVKQILSSSEFGPFDKSKRFGLEFNVGFGLKQNFSVDSLPNPVLLEVAKFALAMNSSQQNFIMEIIEYNFDISLQSEYQRNSFTCEIMKRIRQLKNSEDAVKFSKDIFELPDPMSSKKMANISVGSVNSELGYNISRVEECDVAPGCPAHSHAETKDHIPTNSMEVYPICKEIGLKLHVNKHQPNKKLDISKLTNGAMTEVTNFAETLCGTCEQICLDILRHNLHLDLQSGDSDLARSIVARIPAIVEQRNLVASVKNLKKIMRTRKDSLVKVKLDCQNYQNVDACSAASSQAEFKDQDVGNSPDTKPQNELNLKLWKLRANHIQQILSIPHEEHCPLYSYSRCKKVGIDFNVGSGVKQNLDPKLLTNGIMVELNTFATALLSAQKHFITEILEYNFHLDLKTELFRRAFAQQTMEKIRKIALKKYSIPRMKMQFELPDMRYQQESIYEKNTYCPKCFQDRNQELRQDESDPGLMHQPRPHTITDAVTADAKCTTQKPSKDPFSNFSAIEETIMDSYPRCKKIGLNLCVDKDRPKEKLDTHVLTSGAMIEVASFAKRLCATKNCIIHAVLEHNFNLGIQMSDVNIAHLFHRATALNDGGLAWFNEVLVIQQSSHRQPGHESKLKQAATMQRSEWKEAIKKRKLALQTKIKRATLPSPNISIVKRSKTNAQSQIPFNCYPICTEIGLDLDVTSKSGEKEKLDLKLLTRAAVYEIHKFAIKKTGHYLPNTVYNILDYNFDLSSQHHRRWEFSIATSSKIQTMVKQYRKNRNRPDEVFNLPFVFASEASQRFVEKRLFEKRKKYSREEPYKKKAEGRFVRQVRYHSGVNRIHFRGALSHDLLDPGTLEQMNGSLGSGGPLQRILQIKEENDDPHYGNMKQEPDTEEKYRPHSEDVKTDPGTIVQINGNLVSVGCGSPLQRNLQIKEEENHPHHGYVKPEPDTEEKYRPHSEDFKTESNAEDVEHLVPGEPTGPLAYTLLTLWPNSESQKTVSEHETVSQIKTEWDTEGVKYLVPVEAVGSQEYYMVTIGQGNESTLIKEEQENVSADSHHYGVHRK